MSSFLIFLALLPPFQPAPATEVPPTILVGGALIEHEQVDGYWETEITRRLPGRPLRFRNLGWSGDTVFGHSRAVFGSTNDGYRKLVEQIQKLNPGKTLFAYGMNESFDGPLGLEPFSKGYEKLLQDARLSGSSVLFLTPNRQETLPPPLPDASARNLQLAPYCQAIRQIAAKNNSHLIDLFEITAGLTSSASAPARLTSNGIHFSNAGYYLTSAAIAESFNKETPWKLTLDYPTGKSQSQGNTVAWNKASPGAWKVTDTMLPRSRPPVGCPATPWQRSVQIAGLLPGTFSLSIDGVEVARGIHSAWAKGIPLAKSPDYDQVDLLRKSIREKNQQFFHRWRPQNETYLFGFRKHEQGQNAKEIPQFDPLVASLEKEIQKLSKTVDRVYKISEVR